MIRKMIRSHCTMIRKMIRQMIRKMIRKIGSREEKFSKILLSFHIDLKLFVFELFPRPAGVLEVFVTQLTDSVPLPRRLSDNRGSRSGPHTLTVLYLVA